MEIRESCERNLEHKKTDDSIRQCLLFQGMSEQEVHTALQRLGATEKSYRRGECILHAGDTTSVLGLVLTGSATIENNDIWGNRTILSRVGRGEFFAETYAILEREPLQVDVIASEACTILFLRIGSLRELSRSMDAWTIPLITNLLTISAQKNITLSSRSFHTAPKTIRGRVMAYLNSVSLKKQSREFEIPFDRQQLADYLNLDRSALSKELGKMQREGLLQVRKNHFILETDPDY